MYILYLDESGNADDASDRHFVLGGAAIFERVTYFLSGALDGIQAKHLPGVQPVAFHATDIRAGKGFWRDVPRITREQILADISLEIARTQHPGLFLFAAVVEKSDQIHGETAVRAATEAVVRGFDQFLVRQYQRFHNPQRGIIVFADSHFQKRHKLWVQDFRTLGTQWGAINNLSDIPYFGTPKETRLLQVADMVAHATFVLYERQNAQVITPFVRRFDQWGGIVQGLVHIGGNAGTCECPRCFSTRRPNHFGPWIRFHRSGQTEDTTRAPDRE
jgi:hypothetical protein